METHHVKLAGGGAGVKASPSGMLFVNIEQERNKHETTNSRRGLFPRLRLLPPGSAMEPRQARRVHRAHWLSSRQSRMLCTQTRQGAMPMKPHVLCALIRELQLYAKGVKDLDRDTLLSINRRLIKIQLEVAETLEKIR